jgi:tripartite motif-containing protein 71
VNRGAGKGARGRGGRWVVVSWRQTAGPGDLSDVPWERLSRYEAAINAERARLGLTPVGIGFPALRPTGDGMTVRPGSGGDDRPMVRPEGLAVDRAGNVYVADTGNHRIVKLSPTLEVLGAAGSAGRRPGQFQSPRGIAVDHDGLIYVSDWGTKRVQKVDREFRPMDVWDRLGSADPWFSPTSIAVTRAGEVYVLDDQGRGEIFRVSSTGRVRARWRLPARYQNTRIAVDAHGCVYLFDPVRRILKLDRNGQVVATRTGGDATDEGLSHPVALAIGPTGHVYVLDWTDRYPRLIELDARGLVVRRWSHLDIPGLQYPKGLAVAPDGTIYITDFRNFDERARVLRVTPNSGS